jgi:hypothetical protein
MKTFFEKSTTAIPEESRKVVPKKSASKKITKKSPSTRVNKPIPKSAKKEKF